MVTVGIYRIGSFKGSINYLPWLVEWTINMESVVCSWFRDSKALALTELEVRVEIAIALALQQLLSF